MDVTKMTEERVDELTAELEDWMCEVAHEEDWLSQANDDIIAIWGSKENYLTELIGWVYDHVCSEDRNDFNWWMSHGFTEEEAKGLAE